MTKKDLYRDVDFRQNLKMYFGIVKPYKWLFVSVILLATVIEFLRISESYLFKIILDRGGEFVAEEITRSVFAQALIFVAVVFAGLMVMKVLIHWFKEVFIQKFEANAIYDLKKRFFDHIVELDHNFHTTHKTGAMISRLNRGSGAFERLTDFFVYNVTPLILQIVIIGGSLIALDWAAAVAIVATSLVFIAYGFYISEIQKKAHVESNTAVDIERGMISDVFTNIDSVKYYGKENLIQNKYSDLSTDSKKKLLRFWYYGKLFSAGQSLILGIGTFFVIYFPLMKFLDGGITIGTLAFVYTVYGGLMGHLFGFVHGVRGYYISLGDFDELFEYARIENSIKDKKDAKKLKVGKGEIEFRNVSFQYPNRKESAVKEINLKINPNEKVAFVGYSGSGKTTLVKLLYRFYDIDKGEILIDGEDIKEFWQESLRGELSVVPQEAILFDDTIYNNIKFSNPQAKMEEVMSAMKFAQLDKFVADLPLKENTIVGERGVKLSGGEKQRVSIARAILANKKILVLDEATSALDSQTEHEIQKDLRKLMEGRTSIIIAHRLSTIMRADKIVVLDKGKIVQQGKHTELIKQSGIYKKLWNLQKGGYIEE
ncbi:ABC transporter ATP-binding protein [Candidatus Pacearchaeota archaeon]|nr:ABC transporter ATP-binding protein [Candidatus Pacearchaeota archaeon]